MVRSYYDGLTVASGDVDAPARALVWCHEAHDRLDRLPGMGLRSRELAAPFPAEAWAERWHRMFLRLLDDGGQSGRRGAGTGRKVRCK